MQKYIIVSFVLILLFVGGYIAVIKNRESNMNKKNNNHDNSMMGHDMSTMQTSSKSGYKIDLTSNSENIQPGKETEIKYKILGKNNEIVKDFTVAHEKLMHFIVARKDLQGFQHLHPEFNKDTGEFSVKIIFPTDGVYRMFPDFTPTPNNPNKNTVTLNMDLNVGDQSNYTPQPAIVDNATFKQVGDYKVNYYFPEKLKANTQFDYSLVVAHSDKAVALEPYLGAMGHGVILKQGSLDFIHAHADGMAMMQGEHGMEMMDQTMTHAEPDTIEFSTMFSEAGIYKLFTQFQVEGKVYTTEYVINIE